MRHGIKENQMTGTVEKMQLISFKKIVDGATTLNACNRDSGMINPSVGNFMSHAFTTHQKV